MKHTVCIAQFHATTNKTENLLKIKQIANNAKSAGASILLFPEYAMFYPKENRKISIQNAAESFDDIFCATLSNLSKQLHLWIFAGMYEKTSHLPFNTIVAFDSNGKLQATYRKQKLYDTSFYHESNECAAGTTAFHPVNTPIGRIGILTCYELRFPKYAAEQKKRGADILFIPAGWISGTNKIFHWKTLLAARAIENQIIVLGVNQYHQNLFIGCSAGFDASGTILYELLQEEQTALIRIPKEEKT